jgi:serine/threonine-protein kinase
MAADPGGVVVERYRIDRILRAGTMGVVYQASHLALQAPVVIKMIHPELLWDSGVRPEALARFNVEARVLARLRSPHVVRVLDAGVTCDGCPFIVMEQLEGSDLESLIESQGRLSGALAASCIVQACIGVAELHAAGMVHRDLKPENLFLAQHPTSPPTIKVLDFGLVRLPDGEEGQLRFTRSRRMLGSPAYLAPEQIDDTLTLDHRADVWSLGVVLFELLTGKCPFEEATISESLNSIKTTPSAALRSRLGHVDRRLVRVVMKCLKRDREERYASAMDLADALRPFLSPTCETAVVGHFREVARPAGRPRGALVAASVGLALGAACSAWSSNSPDTIVARQTLAREATRLSSEVRRYFSEARRLAHRVGDEVTAKLAAFDGR